MLLSILDHGPCFNSQKTNLTSLYRHKPACHLSIKKKKIELKKKKVSTRTPVYKLDKALDPNKRQ